MCVCSQCSRLKTNRHHFFILNALITVPTSHYRDNTVPVNVSLHSEIPFQTKVMMANVSACSLFLQYSLYKTISSTFLLSSTIIPNSRLKLRYNSPFLIQQFFSFIVPTGLAETVTYFNYTISPTCFLNKSLDMSPHPHAEGTSTLIH